ncbi:class D sortase [Paenibacillus tepidiphilus]|uniref:class D sortase n=1 Tax=Paenibacillus tepidiphilus TaxID=2608683 RepID=UPI00123A1C9E|nr:class D sortase [Paenibacillus tepidiphilus]
MRKFAYLIILAGVLVMLYPKASEWYNDRQQEKLLQEAEAAYSSMAPSSSSSPELAKPYAEVTELLAEEAEEEESAVPAEGGDKSEVKLGGKVIGIISIESIDVKLPILEGATKANMKHAAAHMKETAPLGGVGNAAIAAHRSRTAGRLFNRLGEMKIGDKVSVKTAETQFDYEVYDISIVEPTDVSVLNGNGEDRILTLITCDPLIDPTHRLIIHAKLSNK